MIMAQLSGQEINCIFKSSELTNNLKSYTFFSFRSMTVQFVCNAGFSDLFINEMAVNYSLVPIKNQLMKTSSSKSMSSALEFVLLLLFCEMLFGLLSKDFFLLT